MNEEHSTNDPVEPLTETAQEKPSILQFTFTAKKDGVGLSINKFRGSFPGNSSQENYFVLLDRFLSGYLDRLLEDDGFFALEYERLVHMDEQQEEENPDTLQRAEVQGVEESRENNQQTEQ